MSEQFNYDVFISHSAKDKPAVRELAERLRNDGLRVWLDDWEIKPGDSIPLKIEQGLEQSRTLVLVMSAHASASEWVTFERSAVMFRDPTNQQRRFIPVRLDDAEIKETLRQFAYVDWRQRANDEYAKLLVLCGSQLNAEAEKSHDTNQVMHLNIPYVEIKAAISQTLRFLLTDRFDLEDDEYRKGGWSKSLSTRVIPLAYPKTRPETASASDSITATQQVV